MSNCKKLNIVVADDDDTNLFILSKIISDLGHNVVDFVDGKPTLDYLYTNPTTVNIVFLDKMMLQMHGLEVVQKMQEHEALKKIPVVIQSGDAFPDKIAEAQKAGASRYLIKPFDNDKIAEVIKSLCDEYGF